MLVVVEDPDLGALAHRLAGVGLLLDEAVDHLGRFPRVLVQHPVDLERPGGPDGARGRARQRVEVDAARARRLVLSRQGPREQPEHQRKTARAESGAWHGWETSL